MKVWVVGGVLCFALVQSGLADVVNIGPSKDNTLYEYIAADGDKSNGQGHSIFAGDTNDNPARKRRAVIAFDVNAVIPSGSVVNSATLTMYMSRTKPGTTTDTIHRLLEDWGEGDSNAGSGGAADTMGGGGAPAQTGDATWRHRFYPSTFWSVTGGVFSATASASTVVADTVGFYSWSSAGLAADVQLWVDNSSTNFGWLVKGDETARRTADRFESRESTDVGFRPVLAVDFTPPAGSGACCLTNGDCVILSAANCAAQSGTYQGDATTCSPNPCPQPPALGACCFSNGTCVVTNPTDCAALGGFYEGDDTSCSSNLCPVLLTPFLDPLPIPAVLAPVSNQVYVVPIQQFTQQLHSNLPPTTVWGYAGSYPGPTIVATRDVPTTVTWSNDLRDAMGDLRTNHYLAVDLCLHGPNTEGATARVVTHLHGGHVPPEADGYPEATILPGQGVTYLYPNNQLPATLWYHDHALGITRLNVMMGLAGFYLLTDAFEQSLGLPSGEYEIGLAIQDRKFNPDGSLQYPTVWDDHFFGDTMLVNGKVWPYLNVKKGKYRFRMLDGCNSRTLTLGLSDGADFQQIGTEGGLLPAPVTTNSITISPGERVDIVMDFEPYAAGTEIILENTAPAPFPGTPGVGVITNVMKFVVQASSGFTGAIPGSLRPIETLSESNSVLSRDFILRKMSSACNGQMWAINDLMWDDITEYPVLGTTEVWDFINPTGIEHPMHMHLVMFQELDRQPFTLDGTNIVTTGPRVPAPATEAGWKDTVQVYPNEIVRVIARFDDYTGKYPYHCHILEHEDHEMMRQFQVVPPPIITSVNVSNANFVLDFLSTTGRLHEVERRDDFQTGGWSVIASNILGNGATMSFTDTNGAASPQHFYRILLQP
jgi:spore coat protein A